jgi:hypothetical protein
MVLYSMIQICCNNYSPFLLSYAPTVKFSYQLQHHQIMQLKTPSMKVNIQSMQLNPPSEKLVSNK